MGRAGRQEKIRSQEKCFLLDSSPVIVPEAQSNAFIGQSVPSRMRRPDEGRCPERPTGADGSLRPIQLPLTPTRQCREGWIEPNLFAFCCSNVILYCTPKVRHGGGQEMGDTYRP